MKVNNIGRMFAAFKSCLFLKLDSEKLTSLFFHLLIFNLIYMMNIFAKIHLKNIKIIILKKLSLKRSLLKIFKDNLNIIINNMEMMILLYN